VSGVLDALARCGGRGGGAATVMYQPLACAFDGEQGQDAGGVARDLLSTLTQQLCAPAAGLFRPAGRGGRALYPVPGPCGAAQVRRYKLLGLVMAKVGVSAGLTLRLGQVSVRGRHLVGSMSGLLVNIHPQPIIIIDAPPAPPSQKNKTHATHPKALIESGRSIALSSDDAPAPLAARRGALGAVTLHLPFAPTFWKVMLGERITFADLGDLDESEYASLRALLDTTLEEGTLFETFELAVAGGGDGQQHGGGQATAGEQQGAGAGAEDGVARAGSVRLVPAGPHKKVRGGLLLYCCLSVSRPTKSKPNVNPTHSNLINPNQLNHHNN
jgi:hypothetical protein